MNEPEELKMKNSNFFQRHPIASYYVLALAWTWLVELSLVAVKQGWIALKLRFSIHYLASLGPALASKVAQDIIPMAMSAMVIVVILIITRVNKPWNFHRLEKKVLF